MANLAGLFKEEIARISRKVLRAETEALKRASSRYRSEIAAMRRHVDSLERQLRQHSRTAKPAAQTSEASEAGSPGFRFRPAGFASHRNRLGLSAREAGLLFGVSPLTIYKWESGQVRPQARHLPAIAAFRKLGRRQARAIVSERS